jgi:hypothetical protein
MFYPREIIITLSYFKILATLYITYIGQLPAGRNSKISFIHLLTVDGVTGIQLSMKSDNERTQFQVDEMFV